MKRSSSSTFSVSLCRSPVQPETVIETENVVVWSRRSMLAATGLFFLLPRYSLASVFQCGPDFRIGILATLTGPLASVQSKYYNGAVQAIETSAAQGCKAKLYVRDTNTSPPSLIKGAVALSRGDRASVVIGPFGIIAKLAAEKASSALIFDILQTSRAGSRPVNLVTLPYAIFFSANPRKKDESLRMIGRVATSIVLETIQSSQPGSISSPKEMFKAMARRKFNSPKGILVLNPATGIFELAR